MILNLKALPPSPNVLRRKYKNPHAYKKLRGEWEHMCLYGVSGSDTVIQWRRTVKGGVKIRLDARLYHKGRFDPDNLVGCLKIVIDALVNVGYIIDDDPAHLELGMIEQIASDEIATVLYLSPADEKPEAA